MIDKKFLGILCCPETKQDVSLMDAEEVNGINAAIAAGSVVNRGGKAVSEPIEAGLVREDGKYFYPIRGGIPIMLIDEAIPRGE